MTAIRGAAAITGAASGIGRATAQRLARRMHVILADIDIAGARALADDLRRDGHAADAVEIDVSDKKSVLAMAAFAEKTAGPIEALFSNAGINIRAPIDLINEDDWDRMMAIHPKGAFLCAQAVLPGMVARGRGAIVNTSSDFAIMGVAGNATYTAAKAAIYSLTKSLASEFTPRGIRINAIGPGPIDTPILRSGRTAEQFTALESKYTAAVPMNRLGRPEEVAVVVDFLLSERSSYISGQILHPNGGQLMW
jgi:NAD(P)-dependent dehydrogenase (short-subunit alcohol dehydrogenase family)